MLPSYLCASGLAAGRLVSLDPPELPSINTGYLARAGAPANAAVARVHDHLRRVMREL